MTALKFILWPNLSLVLRINLPVFIIWLFICIFNEYRESLVSTYRSDKAWFVNKMHALVTQFWLIVRLF